MCKRTIERGRVRPSVRGSPGHGLLAAQHRKAPTHRACAPQSDTLGLSPAALQALRQEEGHQMERTGAHVQCERGASAAHVHLAAWDLSPWTESREDAGHDTIQVQVGVLRCHGLSQGGHQGTQVSMSLNCNRE